MTTREQILSALANRGKTIYWLARAAKAAGICSYAGVYAYLSGKTDMGSVAAGKLLELAMKPPCQQGENEQQNNANG